MPNFNLAQQPRFPLRIIDTDMPITEEVLNSSFENNEGITLCIRSANGHPQRGGFFFCMSRQGNGFLLESLEGEVIDSFSQERMIRFINHTTGLQFDQEMLLYCQNVVNHRHDS